MYFSHSFHKAFVGTKPTQTADPGIAAGVENGFLLDAGIHSVYLKETAAPYALGVGTFGFFDPATNLSVDATSAPVVAGKPLYLAAASLITQDKIGQFHGGYTESNKSKLINPRYVNRFFKEEFHAPEQMVFHIGNTNLGQNCTLEFLCDESYTLRLRVYGAPVLAYLNRDAYRDLQAYTGCCADDSVAPEPVNSMIVFIQWANEIVNSPYLKDFVKPVLFDEAGVPWFHTAADAVAAGYIGVDPATVTPSLPAGIPGSAHTWDQYDTTIAHTPGALGGMILTGAYVGTTFSDCTWSRMDFEEKDVVQIEAFLLDETGDPCKFEGLCTQVECCGYKGQGYRDTCLKEIVLHESYLQNYISCDLRVREVTLGNQIIAAVPAGQYYTKYCLVHSVPYKSNPNTSFADHQYTLTIYIPATAAPLFEAFVATWLAAVNSEVELDVIGHNACTPEPLPAYTPPIV